MYLKIAFEVVDSAAKILEKEEVGGQWLRHEKNIAR